MLRSRKPSTVDGYIAQLFFALVVDRSDVVKGVVGCGGRVLVLPHLQACGRCFPFAGCFIFAYDAFGWMQPDGSERDVACHQGGEEGGCAGDGQQ